MKPSNQIQITDTVNIKPDENNSWNMYTRDFIFLNLIINRSVLHIIKIPNFSIKVNLFCLINTHIMSLKR